jgi:hypothetical protein
VCDRKCEEHLCRKACGETNPVPRTRHSTPKYPVPTYSLMYSPPARPILHDPPRYSAANSPSQAPHHPPNQAHLHAFALQIDPRPARPHRRRHGSRNRCSPTTPVIQATITLAATATSRPRLRGGGGHARTVGGAGAGGEGRGQVGRAGKLEEDRVLGPGGSGGRCGGGVG